MAGAFIVLEGPEGGGKSTQIRRLADRLRARGVDPLVTFEPGGTALSERLRDLVLEPGPPVAPLAEFLVYAAARAQHVQERIAPALQAGRAVLCDRFTASSMAYQGYGRGVDRDVIRTVNAVASAGLQADLTLLYDLPPEEGLARAGRRGRPDRLEGAGLAFHTRVRQGFLELARGDTRWHTLDARAPEAALEAEAWPWVWAAVERAGRRPPHAAAADGDAGATA